MSGESVTKPKSRKVLRQGHAFPARNFSDCPSRARGREENITFVQPLPLPRISFARNFDHHQRLRGTNREIEELLISIDNCWMPEVHFPSLTFNVVAETINVLRKLSVA